MPTISVIVPVYNVEPYLRQCVDSILGQTFRDFELILVDDGSPDGCPAICDEYAKMDSRVKVIHKENGGLSSARNAGLDVAKGKYIAFVDSDDWIHPEMSETMQNRMQQHYLHANNTIHILGYHCVNSFRNPIILVYIQIDQLFFSL